MKVLLSVFIILQFFGCTSETESGRANTGSEVLDTIPRPSNVSEYATLVNAGFIDKPVYEWIEYAGIYKQKEKEYPHIYEFKYYNSEGRKINTLCYEWNKGRKKDSVLNEDFTKYKVILFPGDLTIKLINGSKEFILFNVLEFHKFDREFKGIEYCRIPTVKTHNIESKYGLVYNGEIEFNIKKAEDSLYLVSLIDDYGFKQKKYRLNTGCKESSMKVSYMNQETGRIHLLEKDCYLEPVQ